MNLNESFLTALSAVFANKLRALLTMLGIIIGVAAVITMLALGTAAQRAVDEQLKTLGANILTVTTGMRFAQGVARDQMTLTVDDAAALAAEAHNIAAIVPEQQSRQPIKSGNQSGSIIRTRRGTEYDLRPLIEELSFIPALSPEGRDGRIVMKLSAKEGATGRPEEVLDVLGIAFDETRIERTRLNFIS